MTRLRAENILLANRVAVGLKTTIALNCIILRGVLFPVIFSDRCKLMAK